MSKKIKLFNVIFVSAIILSMTVSSNSYALEKAYLLGNDVENVIPRSGSNYTSTVIDGATASGSVTTNSSSAIANTVYTNPGGKRTAVAYVYYEDCDLYYRSSATSSSTQSGGVQATATRTIIGAEVVGGQGIHSLAYKTYTWNDYTSTGLIPSVIVN